MSNLNIPNVQKLTTATKVEVDESGIHLLTKVTFQAELEPEQIAVLLDLARCGGAIIASFGTPQGRLPFDVDQATGEILNKR